MTFCLGMNLQGGLVGIADTRVIAGNERITARKVSVFQKERRAMFLMSSGLRSARDKALTRAQRGGPRVVSPTGRVLFRWWLWQTGQPRGVAPTVIP